LFAGNGTDAPAGSGKFVRGNDDIGRAWVTGSSMVGAGEVNMSDMGTPGNQAPVQLCPKSRPIMTAG
jgi:hypothetical protein